MKRHRAVQLTQLKTIQFIASNRHDVERVLGHLIIMFKMNPQLIHS
ncbi:conserved hypothetical protein [Vibrio chagasii]|nr:conserved hypothetical protein [Vibrio chagasii]CAH6882241.1 conserved hypothetical protein [Vibrio chagasii]CAH6897936.1 conserved hypothetical protein [Vibrio chagasii]CAH6905070.1 conserved hypothetical protein [Vibrio chagasii]CAH6911652.1 conserved hypothetical protein [Vibrio chagasii]